MCVFTVFGEINSRSRQAADSCVVLAQIRYWSKTSLLANHPYHRWQVTCRLEESVRSSVFEGSGWTVSVNACGPSRSKPQLPQAMGASGGRGSSRVDSTTPGKDETRGAVFHLPGLGLDQSLYERNGAPPATSNAASDPRAAAIRVTRRICPPPLVSPKGGFQKLSVVWASPTCPSNSPA